MDLPEYNLGDVIGGKFEVLGILGRGGCGIVYHVYSRELKESLALKTFVKSHLKERFKKEAYVWINIDRHPHIVKARLYDNVNGLPIIVMEYIEPSTGSLLTLDDYIKHSHATLNDYLLWSLQFCDGMEHVYNRGIVCHRDIKPSNLFIDINYNLKISDFGLAKISGEKEWINQSNIAHSSNFIETEIGTGFGTPAYMPPEQFVDATLCDHRSDIYSFGVVLYEIASHGKLPFEAANSGNYYQVLKYLHSESQIPRIDSPLAAIINTCLSKSKSDRFNTVHDLRLALEKLLSATTTNNIRCTSDDNSINDGKTALTMIWDIREKGLSLQRLGRDEEAIDYFDKYMSMFLVDDSILLTKANSFQHLEKHREAIALYEQILNSDANNMDALNNMAISYSSLGLYDQAMDCCNRVNKCKPSDGASLVNKGNIYSHQMKYLEAIECYKQALERNMNDVACLRNIGLCYIRLSDYHAAVYWYDKAIAIDKLNDQVLEEAGRVYHNIKDYGKALQYYTEAISINPKRNSALINKAKVLYLLSRTHDAIKCLAKCLEHDAYNIEAIYCIAYYYDAIKDYMNAFKYYTCVCNSAIDNNDVRKLYSLKRIRELELV